MCGTRKTDRKLRVVPASSPEEIFAPAEFVTISVGVASFEPKRHQDSQVLVEAADDATQRRILDGPHFEGCRLGQRGDLCPPHELRQDLDHGLGVAPARGRARRRGNLSSPALQGPRCGGRGGSDVRGLPGHRLAGGADGHERVANTRDEARDFFA